MPTLALFDFDGTITRKDSLLEFLKFAVGKTSFYKGMILLSPILSLYLLRIIPNHTAKMLVVRYFLEGWHEQTLRKVGARFSAEKISDLIAPAAMEKLNWHIESGHKVVVVSASIDWWLKPWCDSLLIDCICTQMAYVDGKFCGDYYTPNCYGPEKSRRIQSEVMRLSQYDTIYAYGDSQGDTEMLAMATHACFRKF
jgi:HAD superfamily hydrolase (TIGR01490 family)